MAFLTRFTAAIALAIAASGTVLAADDATDPDDVPAVDTPAADSPAAEAPATDTPATGKSASGLTSQILYQYLVAEFAASRGQLAIATEAYVDLAKTTRDPKIAHRATEVAFFAHKPERALEAARIWAEAEPDSDDARQTLWLLLAATGHGDELSEDVTQYLSGAGPATGNAILQLSRLVARWPDKAAADKLVVKVTAPYEKFPETHFLRAQAAFGVRDNDRALASIERALALRPDWEAAVLFEAQLVGADSDKASDLLGKFVARNPDARGAKLAYARSLIDTKHYAEARKLFAELLEQDKDSPELLYSAGLLSLQVGDLAAGERYLLPLLDTDFIDKDSVRYYLGHGAEEGGRSQDAIRWFDTVSPKSAHYVSARARAANLLRQQGNLDEARRHLQQAALDQPKARNELVLAESRLLVDAHQPEEAYKVLEAALAGEPEDSTLLYESALMAERNGMYDVLERNLQKLIRLKPDNAQAYNALGYSLADRNVRLDEAQTLIEKAMSLAPEDPFILDSRGWIAYRRGDNAGAIGYLRKALAISDDPEVAAHLGEVLWSQGQHDEARATWASALKAHPENEVLPATIKRFAP